MRGIRIDSLGRSFRRALSSPARTRISPPAPCSTEPRHWPDQPTAAMRPPRPQSRFQKGLSADDRPLTAPNSIRAPGGRAVSKGSQSSAAQVLPFRRRTTGAAPRPRRTAASSARRFSRTGVSAEPRFVKWTVQSTPAASSHVVHTARTSRSVAGSVRLSVRRCRPPSVSSCTLFRQAPRSSPDGAPPQTNENGAPAANSQRRARSSSQSTPPSASATRASAQSAWSQPRPSPPSFTSRSKAVAPPRGTSIDRTAPSGRRTGVAKSSFPPTRTCIVAEAAVPSTLRSRPMSARSLAAGRSRITRRTLRELTPMPRV